MAVAAEQIDLSEIRRLAQIDAAGAGSRLLIDGDETYAEGRSAVVDIWSGPGDLTQHGAKLQPDSRASLRVPLIELDSDQLLPLQLGVATGPRPVICLFSEQPFPTELIRALVDNFAQIVADDAQGNVGKLEDVGAGLKGSALPILRGRIFAIEQSVRDALADDELSPDDYAALREYPHRLALVERMAVAVGNSEPTWKSLRPKPQDPFGLARQIGPIDMFFKHAKDVAAEAREAVARLSGLLSSQQVVMVQRQRLEVDRLQRTVTLVGAVILVPGLVAAVFGANVDFQGRDTARGLWAMLLLMAASAIGSLALFRSIETGLWAGLAKRFGLRRASERAVLIGLVAVSAVLLLGAIVVLAL